jgi:hypothetical protein
LSQEEIKNKARKSAININGKEIFELYETIVEIEVKKTVFVRKIRKEIELDISNLSPEKLKNRARSSAIDF